MEIDLAPVGYGNEAMVMLGNQLHDGAVRRVSCAFGLSDLILQLAARGVERISNCNVDIFMPQGRCQLAGNIDVLSSGNGHVNANAISVAPVMAMLRAGDDHARGRKAIVEALKPLRLLANGRLEGIGMADVLEDDLKGYLYHGIS